MYKRRRIETTEDGDPPLLRWTLAGVLDKVLGGVHGLRVLNYVLCVLQRLYGSAPVSCELIGP